MEIIMTELEKIEYAKTFIDKLANGINPIDGSPIPDGDIANNVRLSRCFFYVSDILRQVIENGGVTAPAPRRHRDEFDLTDEERAGIQVSERSLSVSEIAKHLSSLKNSDTTKNLPASTINNWLLSLGLLTAVMMPDGKYKKIPTPQGNAIGILSEEKVGQRGSYVAVYFTSQAQQFIYDNIDAIISFRRMERGEK